MEKIKCFHNNRNCVCIRNRHGQYTHNPYRFMTMDLSAVSQKHGCLKIDSGKFYSRSQEEDAHLLIVGVTLLDTIITVDGMALRTVAISYYIANEGFSILENWGALGLPLPKVLKEALAKLRKDDDNESK